MPASNVTVYAKWTVNSYTVTYLVDDETVSSQTVTYDSVLTAIENPIKEGFVFDGWLLNGELVDLTTFAMPAENVELVASFTTLRLPFNLLAVVGIGTGVAGTGAFAWWLFYVFLPKRRKNKKQDDSKVE
jgi:hypothetical protein